MGIYVWNKQHKATTVEKTRDKVLQQHIKTNYASVSQMKVEQTYNVSMIRNDFSKIYINKLHTFRTVFLKVMVTELHMFLLKIFVNECTTFHTA
jgi:hypothetical protein